MIELSPSDSPGKPSRLAAVILDWAGTTVDFGSRAPVEALRSAFHESGIELTEAEVRRFMGKAKREHIRDLLLLPAVTEKWLELYRHTVEECDIDKMLERFVQRQSKCVGEYSGVIPGCAEAIRVCRQQGMRIGSTTGYTRQLLEAVAARAKSEGYEPDVMVCADDVSPGRPAPWLCFEAARRLNIYPMSATLTVDDTPAGIVAGRNAGSWTAGVVASGNEVGLSRDVFNSLSDEERAAKLEVARSRLTSAGAHFLMDTIAELPIVIARVNERLGNGETP